MKNDRLPKIVLFGQLSRAKQKQVVLVWGERMSQRKFKGNENFLGGCKEGGFE